MLAVVLAVSSHAIWFFWLDTSSWAHPEEAAPEQPTWTLLTWPMDDEDHPLANALEIWSPAHFALPVAHGFSRPLLEEEVRVRPPVQRPVETAMVRERSDSVPTADPAVRLPEWSELRVHLDVQELHLPAPTMPEPARIAERSPVPRVQRVKGMGDRASERLDLTEDAALWGTGPWSAKLSLHVDEWGAVTRVILDQRTPDTAVNEQLVRQAAAWRWAPADRTDTVRVRVIYGGATPEEEGP